MSKKTIQDFIEESQIKHPNKYSYDRCLEYTNNKAKMEIFCNTCKDYFQVTSNDHLGKKLTGCPSCGLRNRAPRTTTMTFQKLLEASTEKHGAIYEILDDSETYPGSYKLSLKCKEHGDFKQSVTDHLRKHRTSGGCPQCSLDKRRVSKTIIKDYMEKASTHFNDKYDYSDIDIKDIKNLNQLVSIKCPVHGQFEQNFKVHFIKLSDCNKCSKTLTPEIIKEAIKSTIPDHISSDNIILYYKNNSNFVRDLIVQDLYCKDHKITYETSYRNVTSSVVGCPSCRNSSTSQYELEIINILKDFNFTGSITQSYRPDWLQGRELDIFIPSLNIAIEFNGTVFHHSSNTEHINSFFKTTCKDKSYHYNKWKTCFDNGVILISVYDFYWKDIIKKEIYKSKFHHALGLDNKIYARKCEIKVIPNSVASSFYLENHLEGSGFNYKGLVSYGLYNNDILVMCASIGDIYNQSSKLYYKKLQRICTSKFTTVVGGISKLTKYMTSIHGAFNYQITLDSGGSTLKLTPKLDIKSLRYFWVHPVSLEFYNRNYCQKSLLEKHFEAPIEAGDTENSYMERLGYLKVYDSGVAEL